ncbi:DUF7144 family membrane protein [Solicola gregarius]|uniref:DUF7144 domain-containing protein n=1 Tax=Solicola gregarius TaxID=2908642 RepID=A0AA46TFH8_9ACTN|nr:hypothetical protein [Solicola gregarius]UYM03623.1 hypothetical protein L0C25_13800 [Solicola gregarius]
MSTSHSGQRGNPFALGVAVFAAALMLVAGAFQVLQGIVAIANDEYFVTLPNYTYEFDLTAWGWIHLVIGIILVLVGVSLFSGRLWARATGIAIASISAIANFLWLPYQPWWAILVIAIDILVIWALATYRPVD